MKDLLAAIGVFLFILLLIAVIVAESKGNRSKTERPEIAIEQQLGDKVLPGVSDVRVVVLPTGERVLVMTGGEGRGFCCLLPPLAPGAKSVGKLEATP